MRVTSILSLSLVVVFRPCAAATADEVNAQCHTNDVQFDGDVVANPLWSDDKGARTLSDCLLDCSLASDVNGRPCVAIEWSDGGSTLSSTESRNCAFAWACDYTASWGGGSVFLLPTTTASPTHDCADFNIDGVLNECSADFPAEKEALEAATARVTQLESDTATTDAAVEALSADLVTLQSEAAMSANLAATDATVEALSADLSTLESLAAATTASLVATDATVESLSADLSTLESEVATTTANLASTDVAVSDLSSRLDSTEESVQNDYAALENRLAEIETWKAAWQNFESARAGPGIDIGAENELEQAANVSVFELSASSPLMIGAMALLAVLLAANLCFVTRSCSARAKGKYATVAAVDSADSEEMAPIRV